MGRIDAVLWDADGVLQELAGFDELWGFLADPDREALLASVFDDMPAVLTGRVDMAERVDHVINALGLLHFRDAILATWDAFPPVSESLALVASLRASGVRCVLATNQDSLRERNMRPVYADLLDGLYFSSAMGLAKPDPAYFTFIAADLGLPPERLLFIDDNRDNVAGAIAAGLHAEWWHHASGEPLAGILGRYGL